MTIPCVNAFFDRLIVRAATVDELLSDDFEALPGQKGDVDLAGRRLTAWCRSSASGDWSLFTRRLDRDHLSIGEVLAKFSTVRRKASASVPAWIRDAIWIEAALQSRSKDRAIVVPEQVEPCAFEHLFAPVVEQAEELLWAGIGGRASENLNASACASLRHLLFKNVCSLSAPAIYERFVQARKAGSTSSDAREAQADDGRSLYDRFIADMKGGGFRRLFEDKPVLLRLIASITRQWIDTAREFILRLDSDLATIRHDILCLNADSKVAEVEGDLSDPHNGGRSVLIVTFEDGPRIVYKPKDLHLDVAWHELVGRLNCGGAPITLKAVRAIARDRYGWTEFVNHTGCADDESCKRFFARAGAWLALFYCFAGSDMHQENMIAAGEHPVPIDLEMILQATASEYNSEEIEAQAFEGAKETIDNSVITVGLLPAYSRSPENEVLAIGAMTSDWTSRIRFAWSDINSDAMRPVKRKETDETVPNLPHVDGRYAKFGDYIDDFIDGFEGYAKFLLSQSRNANQGRLFVGFNGLAVRKVIRPTRFYDMLLQRLKNHHSMGDGVIWSTQADFVARLADWERATDPLWQLQRAERAALLELNIPHFVSPSDRSEIHDASGISILTEATPGLPHALARMSKFDEADIAWQVEIIRQNTGLVSRSEDTLVAVEGDRVLRSSAAIVPDKETFLRESDKIAVELARYAIRKGPAAAWIGLDWLGDSEVAQLAPLGADLYNGVSGIALFLAAHAKTTGSASSRELALAAIAHLRKTLKGRNAAREARLLGTGGATGLGSVVYAFAVIADFLRDVDLLADAHAVARLFSDDLIRADKQLDVIGGSAGAILGLLRLYRDSPSAAVLASAAKCGDHLLAQPRRGENGGSWRTLGERPLNGMSHGAAGFAYALASLASATGRSEFADAAAQCIAFENASYDAQRNNWPDFRAPAGAPWLCQWCHGAPGIGIARAACAKRSQLDAKLLTSDIRNALAGAQRGWPSPVDTLCCGTLGTIEFFCEAADSLGQDDLREKASRYMATLMADAAVSGDYCWNTGKRQFNLGLFRGLAGVGYTLLRRVDSSLPNVLVWE